MMMHRGMKQLVSVAAAAAVTVAAADATSQSVGAKGVDYTTRKGDTCAGIALRFYGDARRVDLIHESNAALSGPPPHHLVAGTVLHVPPKRDAVATPDAKLTFVRNKVEIFVPSPKPGTINDPLFRGNRVNTERASSANVIFRDETELRLSEDTLIIILGDMNAAAARANVETTLVTGSLRARLGALAGKPSQTLATAAATITLGVGEAKVEVEAAKKTTRLAVYTGRSALTAQKKTVTVEQGFGSKAVEGQPPIAPRALPVAPTWAAPPPALVMAGEAGADVSGKYTASVAPTQWHVQLSRDASFDDLAVDVRVPASVDVLRAERLAPGAYVARVSAVDDEGFEGPFGPVARVGVARARVTRLPGHRAQVGFEGATLRCALDDAPLAPVSGTLEVDARASHALRCAPAEGGAGAEVAIAAASIEADRPVLARASARLVDVDAAARKATLELRVVDDTGAAVPSAGLRVEATVAGVDVGALAPGESGALVAKVGWREDVPRARVRVRDEAGTAVESDEVVLPKAPPAPPDNRDRFALAAMGGPVFLKHGVGARVALEPSWLLPAGPMELQVGARVGLELHGKAVPVQVAGVAGTATHTDITIGLPMVVRLRAPGARLAPYIAAVPELALQQVSATLPGGPLGESAALFNVSALGGLDLRLGPGAIFLEGGYRGTVGGSRAQVFVPLDGGVVGVGYRWVP